MKRWYRIKTNTSGEQIDLNEIEQISDAAAEGVPPEQRVVTFSYKSGRQWSTLMAQAELTTIRILVL